MKLKMEGFKPLKDGRWTHDGAKASNDKWRRPRCINMMRSKGEVTMTMFCDTDGVRRFSCDGSYDVGCLTYMPLISWTKRSACSFSD
jgi:hypothetical protein